MSTQTKWTPGPWTFRGFRHGYKIDGAFDPLRPTAWRQIAIVKHGHDGRDIEANARLISLAPEMAEALRESILKADELAAKLSAVKDMFPLDHPMQNAAAYEVELTKARAILAELEGGDK